MHGDRYKAFQEAACGRASGTVTSGVAKGKYHIESKGANAKKGRGHLVQPLHFTEERMTTSVLDLFKEPQSSPGEHQKSESPGKGSVLYLAQRLLQSMGTKSCLHVWRKHSRDFH